MRAYDFIDYIRTKDDYHSQIVHLETIPSRKARYGILKTPVHQVILKTLEKSGIKKLYSHQTKAIDLIHEGNNVVIVTSTASGKTLCYTIPVLDSLLKNPGARMLFMYPTKALAQDQLRVLSNFKKLDNVFSFYAGTYDGDTPTDIRRKLREEGNIILTNPDMLHQGLLPNHTKWSTFFSNLKYIVIDEIHYYRGLLGSNVSNLIKRLHRICKYYGSNPVFICCSATIANPVELTERILSKKVHLVDNDGSPRGPKKFILWNPPVIDYEGFERASSLNEGMKITVDLVRNNIQTITFSRTRLSAELIYKYCQEFLQKHGKMYADAVRAYRGGYLPEERREIESKLASGEILGVSSTNALELGIDIGGLDACISVGYPGTIASTWQQAGRAGRGQEESVVFLIAQNSPIDQFIMKNPDYLFGKSPENAVIDPENPHISIGHLRAALYETPLRAEEKDIFGEYTLAMLQLLEEDNQTKFSNGNWYFTGKGFPAADVNLRSIDDIIYTIIDTSEGNNIIGTMDELSAFSQLHDHAVYIHNAETYFVDKLDTEKKIALVERKDVDYYTQSVCETSLKIDETELKKDWNSNKVYFGDVTLNTIVTAFKKIKFHTKESIGFENVSLPEQILETMSLWVIPGKRVFSRSAQYGRTAVEGLIGIANVMVEVVSLFGMCDTSDVGAMVDAANTNLPALFLFDKFPGGMGFSEKIYDIIDKVFESIYRIIKECPCKFGCPSCVGAAVPYFARTPGDSFVRGKIPDKETAMIILHEMLSLEPYIPQYKKPEIKYREQYPIPPQQKEKKTEPLKRLDSTIEKKIRKRIQSMGK